MPPQSPSRLRYLILLIPALTIAGYVIKKRSEPKPAAVSSGSSGMEMIWHCRIVNGPHYKIFDSSRLTVAVPQSKDDKAPAGVTSVVVTILTPRPIQYHLVDPSGMDVRYRKHVCKFTLVNRSFNIVEGEALEVNSYITRINDAKRYVTFGENGAPNVTTKPPSWFTALGKQHLTANADNVFIEERYLLDTKDVSYTPDNQTLSARALKSSNLMGLDCRQFAIGVQNSATPVPATNVAASVLPMDIILDSRSGTVMDVNGIEESFWDGYGTLKVGGAGFTILNHGRYLQTPTGTLALTGTKQYITVSPTMTITVTATKPPWFSAFDKAPPIPPGSTYTVSPE